MASAQFHAQLSMNSHKITDVTDPASAQDAATKAYVDAATSGGGGGASVGTELDYVERSTTLTVTPTTDATAASFIDGNAVTYNGSTRVKIEFWAWVGIIDTGNAVIGNLYDGLTDLGRIVGVQNPTVTSGSVAAVVYGVRFLTPSNASHTFHIKFWKTGGTATVNAGAGGTATTLPAWYRITTA